MKGRRVLALLAPVSLAAYSILSLYAWNINELEFGEVLPTFLLALLGTAVMIGLLGVAFRDARKVTVFGSLLTLGIFYYGVFFIGLDTLLDGQLSNKLFLPAFTLLLGAVAWMATRSDERLNVGSMLCVIIAIALLVMPLAQIARHQLFEAKPAAPFEVHDALDVSRVEAGPSIRRNIYYLIFDRYAANRTLKRLYNFDNEEFLGFLRSAGFFVADDSYANYLKTAHSLASSLNMTYLDALSEQYGGGSADYTPLHRMLKDFKVQRVLKSYGYRYVHLGSFWEPTRRNEFADENYNVDRISEFQGTFLRNTLLLSVGNVLDLLHMLNLDERKRQCERLLYKFKKLNELVEAPGPSFVFAHMLIPHPPYVFDAGGNCLSREQVEGRPDAENYINQVRYANVQIKHLVTRLLSLDPKPIVIIQSDEGPFPERFALEKENFDWREATEGEMQEKLRILNALYLPGLGSDELYAAITPVNTFRLIFREYFGLDYELLRDRGFAFLDGQHLYDFLDVTAIVK